MDDKLTWIFELVDRMTGPAKRITRSLDLITKSLGASLNGGRLGKMFSTFGPGFQKAAFQMVNAFGNPFVQGMARAAMSGMRAAGGAAAAGGAFLARGLAGALTLVAGAATVGLGLGVAGAKWATEALMFQENATIAFETILRSKEAAKRVMGNAIAFAAATPFETKDVIADYQKLLVAGFKEAELNPLMAAAGDIGSAFGSEKQAMIIDAFRRIRAEGKLSGEAMQTFTGAGVGVTEMAKALGMTVAQMKRGIEAGTITGDTGILAALNVIKETVSGGELGGMMAKQSRTLAGMWSSLASRPYELLIAADTTGALDSIKAFLGDLTAALDPASETGKRVIGIFNAIGASLQRIFGTAREGRSVATSFEGILNVVEPLVKGFLAYGEGAFKGLLAGVKPFMDVAVMMDDTVAPADRLARGMGKMGETFGRQIPTIVAGLVAIAGAVPAVATAVVYVADKIRALADIGPAGTFMADSLTEGFKTGILSGLPGISDAIRFMGSDAIATLKSVLGIASPSKAFEELGLYSAQGYLRGLEKGDIAGAMNDNALMPSPSANAFGAAPGAMVTPAAASAGAAAFDVGGVVVHVTVNGKDADPAAMGAAVAAGVESAFLDVFQRMPRQTGT